MDSPTTANSQAFTVSSLELQADSAKDGNLIKARGTGDGHCHNNDDLGGGGYDGGVSDNDDEEEEEEEEEREPAIMGQLAADLMQQYDPSRMKLSPQEHQWAMAIKKTIQELPDLDALSDFWYAHLAIVSEGNTEDAVAKAYRLQEHKKINDILDTPDDGLRNLPKEANWISIDYNLHTGGYTIATDVTKTNGALYRDPEELQYFNRRIFYAGHMAFCDLAALRAGLTSISECEGYRLVKGKTMDLHAFRSMWKGVHAYPARINQVKFFNSPTMLNAMVSVAKLTLPKEVTANFHVGAKCPLGRLDKLYHLPTPEIAKARLQERMKDLIRKRYINEMCFSLEQHEPTLAPSAHNVVTAPNIG